MRTPYSEGHAKGLHPAAEKLALHLAQSGHSLATTFLSLLTADATFVATLSPPLVCILDCCGISGTEAGALGLGGDSLQASASSGGWGPTGFLWTLSQLKLRTPHWQLQGVPSI